MTIVGIDLGYTYTKTSDGDIFPSMCTQSKPILGGKQITFDEQTYFMGEGIGTVDVNKIDSDVTKACLMYALGKLPANDSVKLVTGLPIGQYQTQETAFKKMILDNRYKTVVVDECRRTIYIDDVKIYPQGAGALYSQNIPGDAILVDIGGRTVDIAFFGVSGNKRKLEKSCTLYDGMLVLYSAIIEQVNANYDLTLPAKYAENILIRGLTIEGEPRDISFLAPTISVHVERICEAIRLNYPYKTTSIYLCGGGGEILKKAFERRFKHVSLMENSQFANAIGFRKVGEMIWQTNR
ncbi:MAG TPA: ParM/StbA family protein [Clostridia bacterium]|nr:ParM/StbA family protein [Clostridia bacterium]